MFFNKSKKERELPSPQVNGEFHDPVMHKFSKTTHLRWVLSHVFVYKKLLSIFIISTIANTSTYVITPILIGDIFNELLAANSQWIVIRNLAIIILLINIFYGITSFISGLIIEITSQKVERDIRDEYYASMLSKSMTFHDEVKAGDVMARATFDTRMVNFFVNPVIHLLFSAGLALFLTLIGMLWITPFWNGIPLLLVLPLLLAYPVYLLAVRFYKSVGPISVSIQESYSSLSSYAQEKLLGISVLKAFAREPFEKSEFKTKNDKLSFEIIERGKIRAKYFPALVMSIGLGFSILWGSVLIDLGLFDIGNLIAYTLLMMNLFFPVWVLSWSLVLAQMGFAGADRILQILTKETIIPEPQNPVKVNGITGEVKFDNVSFSYNKKTNVIDDVSFTVPAGSRVAIVGPAGCGKTTLMKLLTRLYDSDKGTIYIDGNDIKAMALRDIRRNVGVIEQDIVLFSATIRENIAYGNNHATEEQVIEAAKLAQAHDFIVKFEKGYETIVGERGTTLSGGQKQRIAIARMLLSNPTILVFDDASSAVDSETEDKINTAINRVLTNRTSFVITHRLSTIRHSDIIVVMKQGKVLAIGKHDELLQKSVDYWRVFARFSEIRRNMPEEMQATLEGSD